MEFSFELGEKEKHRVDFSWNQMTGALRIAVDGAIVAQKALTLMSPTNVLRPLPVPDAEKWRVYGFLEVQLVEKWRFEVGSEEKHEVRIEKRRPKWLAPFRPHTYRVFVDDQLVDTREGY